MDSVKFLKNEKKSSHYRTRILVLSFVFLILLGACLLNLPVASQNQQPTGFLNALFTATSAVCVTGLSVVTTVQHWSLFGQIVILLLIQIGGLGMMTLVAILLMVARKRILYDTRVLLQESLGQESNRGVIRFVRSLLLGTVIFEGSGALLLSLCFIPEYGLKRGLFMGIFHSVSAFCNAGFDVVGSNNLMPFVKAPFVNLIVIVLIVIGGLGFTVWRDCLVLFRGRKELSFRQRVGHLELHSKLVLTITPVLLFGGMVFFWLAEHNNPDTMGSLSLGNQWMAALFQSTTTRTAGFNTISQADLTYASKLMSIFLMFIGGSPVSTAGGVKTVTIGVLFFAVRSVIQGRKNTVMFHKTLSFGNFQKALAVFLISLAVLLGVTVMLTVTEKQILWDYECLDIVFEVVSALGTTGLSTGITPFLSAAGKLLLILCMFMGRLGPITIVVALSRRQRTEQDKLGYPEENVMIG